MANLGWFEGFDLKKQFKNKVVTNPPVSILEIKQQKYLEWALGVKNYFDIPFSSSSFCFNFPELTSSFTLIIAFGVKSLIL